MAESIPPVQFSIRGLLIATTLAALVVMGGKWIFEHVEFTSKNDKPDLLDLNPLVARAAVATGLALVSLAAWWAVFRPRRVWLTCLVIAAAAGGCGMLMTLLLHESDAWMSFGLWWLLHAVGMMVTLAPLPQMGFRLAAMPAQKAAAAPMKMKSYGGKVPVTGVTS